jgi:CRP-like cAMP-binding protein
MSSVHDTLIRKIREHTSLSRDDLEAIRKLTFVKRLLASGEDVVRQGDKPRVSIVVTRGVLARYHTRTGGGRQYLSFHIAGDLPDAQALFLDVMDHAVCAIGAAEVALVPHKDIFDLFERRLSIGYAFWRETLIDAAIFREAITNNSSRPVRTRIAHFFCEQYYRAQAAGIAEAGSCALPLSQIQLGETLGISVVTANRGLQALRRTGAAEFRDGVLTVRNWKKLMQIGEFNPSYLHLIRQSRI